jgi:hypothetical protein
MSTFTNIGIIFIVVLLTFFIGLAIVGIVDKRLQDLQINLPKQNIVLKVPEDKTIIESFRDGTADYKNIIPKPSNEELGDSVLQEIYENKLTNMDQKIYNNPFVQNDKNVNVSSPKQNYPNPSKMSSVEKNAYKFGYPSNMTMQDYVNWLYLFRENENLLTLEHVTNLQKLKNNINLEYAHGKVPPPPRKVPPINADNYFNNLYQDNQVSPSDNLNSITSSLMGYNYKDYVDFENNFDVYGKSGKIFNDDLGIKTDPKVLQKFIGPNHLPADIKESEV